MRRAFRSAAALVVVALLTIVVAAKGIPQVARDETLAQLADDASRTLTTRWYAGDGRWRMCVDSDCAADGNVDWAADSLTGALFLRWLATGDASLIPRFRALEATQPQYEPCRGRGCRGWSDVPMWDAVAAIRIYDATRDQAALRTAALAYARVATSDAYATGACPAIDYQRPQAEGGGLKTLETDANRTLAAVLLAERTRRPAYLDEARREYDAIRHMFFEDETGLYTVYVFDSGAQCRRLPHRYFASVNGVMIEAGLELSRATGNARYASDAHNTAHALRLLDNDRGIFTDLQAENDVVEPLVLALFKLARGGDNDAKEWIVRNAAAAAHARRADGSYGRFFDGPPPEGSVTAWQSNGGLALAIAAGAIAPHANVDTTNPWTAIDPQAAAIGRLPSTLSFSGSGIALIGTIGERCCEPGRARVIIDGREPADHTGIWQNKSSIGRSLPNSVLFAWRWPASGPHVLRFEADAANAKEGGPFLHITRTVTLP